MLVQEQIRLKIDVEIWLKVDSAETIVTLSVRPYHVILLAFLLLIIIF